MVEVILVDKNDNEIDHKEKILAHKEGLLHRAFSIFVFDQKTNELLIQKRASNKYHCPNIWTNTCCSHPFPEENIANAANRRIKEEMGFCCKLKNVGSFIYRAEFDNGLIEHEFDHVFIGIVNKEKIEINFNTDEVCDYKWISLEELKSEIKRNKKLFSPWLEIILKKHPEFILLDTNTRKGKNHKI